MWSLLESKSMTKPKNKMRGKSNEKLCCLAKLLNTSFKDALKEMRFLNSNQTDKDCWMSIGADALLKAIQKERSRQLCVLFAFWNIAHRVCIILYKR